jgi:hypothetical protein
MQLNRSWLKRRTSSVEEQGLTRVAWAAGISSAQGSRESESSRMVHPSNAEIAGTMPSPRQGDLFGKDGPDPSDEDFETPTY